MATSPDYPIMGPPRISAAGFATVLARASSPAASSAAAAYSAFTAAGVDPAVGLAVFRKESTYGTAGRAVRNRSWGNIRGGATYPLDNGNFRIYPSWAAGAQDAARLLAIYGRNQIRPGTRTDTVQTFPFVWAPSSDGNAPDAYGDQLAGWIASWARQYPAAGSNAPGATPGAAPASSSPDVRTTLAAYLGIPASTVVTMEHVKTAADRIATASGAWNRAYPVVLAELRLYLEGHPGIQAGAFPIVLNEKGQPPRTGEVGPLDPIGGLVAPITDAIGGILTNFGYLVAILVLIILGLWLLVRSGAPQ